jgi:hypothetical protein
MSEAKRGCGYRKIGGLYLVSDPGQHLNCDGLPLELQECQCCGFKPPFSRNLQRINAHYIGLLEGKHHMENRKPCHCWKDCPTCFPDPKGIYGLMFVGQKSYTPSTFIKEAFSLGVSKRIPEIPSWLKLGETWIFLAHLKTPNVCLALLKDNGLHMKEPEMIPAIFYGFKPQRVEMPTWKGDLTDAEIVKLEHKGITPILLERTPESIKNHKDAKAKGDRLEKYLREEDEE